MEPIKSFKDKYRFLSNFWPSKIIVDGWEFKTVEHAYQASKAVSPRDCKSIQECSSPAAAKRLGGNIAIRPDWESVKLEIMESLLIEKFKNSMLKSQLLETGDAELIEGNTWGDTFWGVYRGKGENHLGKMLMNIRNDIRLEKRIDAVQIAQEIQSS